MSDQQNKNEPLDIWGEPVGEKKECFYCGGAYYAPDSDAPASYQKTYCSLHCYERDTLQLKMSAEAEARFNANQESSGTDTDSESYTSTRIGDFVLKIKRTGENT